MIFKFINKFLNIFHEQLISFPQIYRNYPFFSQKINLFRIKFWEHLLTKNITFNNFFFISKIKKNIPYKYNKSVKINRVLSSLQNNGIVVIKDIIESKDFEYFMKLLSQVNYDQQYNINNEILSRKKSIDFNKLPICLNDLKKYINTINKNVFGVDGFYPVTFDIFETISSKIPENVIKGNNVPHIDRFLPNLKFVYCINNLSKNDSPFCFVRHSHYDILQNKSYLIENYSNKNFYKFINNISLNNEIIDSTNLSNSLIIFNTSGIHYRKPFEKKGVRYMCFMEMYRKFSKIKIINYALKK